jgi:hypothetical protein
MMQAVPARSQAVPMAEAETIPNEGARLARVATDQPFRAIRYPQLVIMT